MTDLKQAAMQLALDALVLWEDEAPHAWSKADENAVAALRAALAEPQTTHWEGCEAVHPECKTEQEIGQALNELEALNAELVEALRRIKERKHGIGDSNAT